MAKTVPEKTLSEADLAEAKKLDRQLTDAFSRKDLDGVMACMWNSRTSS